MKMMERAEILEVKDKSGTDLRLCFLSCNNTKLYGRSIYLKHQCG